MKIICSGHNGPIDVSDKNIIDAHESPLQKKVIHCPVCKKQVLIHHVQMNNESQESGQNDKYKTI